MVSQRLYRNTSRAASRTSDNNAFVMWRDLLQRYAIVVREYSDSVAALGREGRRGPRASETILDQVRSRKKMCDKVADEVDHYVHRPDEGGNLTVQTLSAKERSDGDTP